MPCEKDDENYCPFVRANIHDEEDGMLVPNIVSNIAKMWLEITQISSRDERAKGEGKSARMVLVPTLGKIEIYLDNMEWELMEIGKKEAFHLIKLFHIYYMASL